MRVASVYNAKLPVMNVIDAISISFYSIAAPWHRSWKNNFPVEWQEVFLRNEQTGEKHIADVNTEHRLIIEFQHSHLNPKERIARRHFYRNMVWVVDATRLKYDYIRLCKGQQYIQPANLPGVFHVTAPDKCLPSAWLSSSVQLFLIFQV